MFFQSSLPKDKRYFPMLLTEAAGEEAALSLVAAWNQYKTLPKETKAILVSDEISEKLRDLQEKFHIEIDSLGKISLLVRKLFFGEVNMAELEEKIRSMLTDTKGGDPNQAGDMVTYIQKEILTLKPKPRVEEIPEEPKSPQALVKMSLLQALSKYEQLGNQLITRERIKIRSQGEPVRPSLLYWIKYYRDELGVGHHDSVQRGNFLFRSENGKRLSPEERERVNLVLKSVEENLPLEIDTERSEIIFPLFEAPKEAPRPVPATPPLAPKMTGSRDPQSTFSFGKGLGFGTPAAGPADPSTLSFSSKHVFPAEKAKEVPAATPSPQAAPKMPTPPRAPQTNPFHIRPVSLGKEE